MLVIDSSCWIEYFTNGLHVRKYEKYLNDLSSVITPTIVIYEVYKKIKRERTEEEALIAISLMNRTVIAQLDESISLTAADVSLKYSLPMADAIVYATGLENDCKIVTGDSHFKGLDHVIYIE